MEYLFSFEKRGGMSEFYVYHEDDHDTFRALRSLSNLQKFELLDFYGEDLMEGFDDQNFDQIAQFVEYLDSQIISLDDFFYLKLKCAFEEGQIQFTSLDNNEFIISATESMAYLLDDVFKDFAQSLFNLNGDRKRNFDRFLSKLRDDGSKFILTDDRFEEKGWFDDFDDYLEYCRQ